MRDLKFKYYLTCLSNLHSRFRYGLDVYPQMPHSEKKWGDLSSYCNKFYIILYVVVAAGAESGDLA